MYGRWRARAADWWRHFRSYWWHPFALRLLLGGVRGADLWRPDQQHVVERCGVLHRLRRVRHGEWFSVPVVATTLWQGTRFDDGPCRLWWRPGRIPAGEHEGPKQ